MYFSIIMCFSIILVSCGSPITEGGVHLGHTVPFPERGDPFSVGRIPSENDILHFN